jgi:hypothetical protein
VKEGESPSVFAVALSEGIAAVAPSSAALEKISAAGEAGEARQRARIESWQAYRPEDRDPEFWAARKPEGGTGPARPFLRIGFSAASAADGTTLHLTYLFENKVPEEYVVGAALNSERDGYLPILDYGAAITVESVNGPKLVCKVRLDEGRGLDAAGATILAKLRTSARFRGGEKSP